MIDTFGPGGARGSVRPPDDRSLLIPTARASALLLLAVALAVPATAQPAARVADLTTAGLTGSAPSGFARLGGIVYFSATDAANGYELWRTDGTAANTWLVKDLYPGPDSSAPRDFTVVGDRLFFVAANTLWTTDGSAAGTVRVGADLPDPLDLVELGGILYFTVDSSAFGRELWRTDGTPVGTAIVKDIIPGPDGALPWFTVAFQGSLFFAAVGAEGDELWTSDGTEAGTVLVRDILPGPFGSGPLNLRVAGDTLFFTAITLAAGREVWKTDGTTAGTVIVKDIAVGGFGQAPSLTFAAVGSRVFFGANDDVAGNEPWVSDGTEAGTFMLRDVRPGPDSGGVFEATAVGSAAYFTADDGTNGWEVWRSDGTAAGTELLGPVSAGAAIPNGLAAFGDALVFTADDGVHGRELWRADGTTLTLLDLNPGVLGSEPDGIVWTDDALFFGGTPVGQDPSATVGEPWRSDGTLAGTHQIAALRPAASSSMSYGIAYAGAYYFLLARPETGFELWRSDGTEAGTALFLDLLPGPASGFPASFTVKDGLLYFCGSDATGIALWRTDGTVAGTAVVKRFPEHPSGTGVLPMELVGRRLFLVVGTSATGAELWTSDGTEAGTVLVRDVNPGPVGSVIDELTAAGDVAVFRAFDGTGSGLWRSDGSAAGTIALVPGSAAAFPNQLAAAGHRAFFTAEDPSHGRELWVTDGTAPGTTLVADLLPGPDASAPNEITALGSDVLFAASDETNGRELWRSDGTPGGTARVADVWPGAGSSAPSSLTESGGTVFFAADDGASGREPWRTDGTGAGTVRLADVWPGAESSMTSFPTSADWGGWTFFAAAAPGTGTELWRTDGTPAGTRLVQEIGPGESSAGIDFSTTGGGFTPAGGRLFFRAVDETGLELWSLLPELSASDAAAGEGQTASLTVSLVPRVEKPVTVAFATADLTATAGTDYVPRSGTLTFAPGEIAHEVLVSLLDDALDEGLEHFTLTLASPSVAFLRDASGLGSILDDDAYPVLAVGDAAVIEGDAGSTLATFVVTRVGSSAAETTVPYATLSGTATAGDDFGHVSGTVTFAPGVSTRTVTVPVLGDLADEPDERFLFTIGPASGATIGQALARGTIQDDDGASIRLKELGHGSVVRGIPSAGAGPVDDVYVLLREPHSSYEVVLDEASGDLGDSGPRLERVAPDLSTVLQSSVPSGVGHARSLRIVNDAEAPAVDYVRVRSAGCATDCGPDDVYRLRVRETTARISRFNASGGQATVVLLQNRTDAALSALVTWWIGDGAEGWTQAVALAPHGLSVVPTPASVAGASGSITIAHDGPYGALVGKSVALDPRTGLAFDTPLEARPR